MPSKRIKKKKFVFTGEVRRTVVDTITIGAYGDTEEEAANNARRVLEDYPQASLDDAAYYCYIENRESLDSELLSLTGTDIKI